VTASFFPFPHLTTLRFLQNNGTSNGTTNNGTYVCECPENFSGDFCENESETSKLSAGAIVGIVLGCIVGLVIIAGGCCYCRKKEADANDYKQQQQ